MVNTVATCPDQVAQQKGCSAGIPYEARNTSYARAARFERTDRFPCRAAGVDDIVYKQHAIAPPGVALDQPRAASVGRPDRNGELAAPRALHLADPACERYTAARDADDTRVVQVSGHVAKQLRSNSSRSGGSKTHIHLRPSCFRASRSHRRSPAMSGRPIGTSMHTFALIASRSRQATSSSMFAKSFSCAAVRRSQSPRPIAAIQPARQPSSPTAQTGPSAAVVAL